MMELRKLDRSRDFGEVYGVAGCRYVQDGIPFNAGGIEVKEGQIVHFDDEPTPPSPRDDTPIHPATVMGDEPPKEDDGGIEGMPWRKLKLMVESFGGSYTNRAEAIAFLRGNK